MGGGIVWLIDTFWLFFLNGGLEIVWLIDKFLIFWGRGWGFVRLRHFGVGCVWLIEQFLAFWGKMRILLVN